MSINNFCNFSRSSLISEEKLKLDYELKQRTESMNKRNNDLRNENENLQINLNDK